MSKVIYCITTNDGPLNLELTGCELESVAVGPLVAVVSETNETRLRISRTNSMRHQKVIEHIMSQRTAVLPMRFSTITESEAVIADRILTQQSPALLHWLEHVKDTNEFSLKVFWPHDALFVEVAKRDPELISLRAEAQSVNAQIALGQRIEKDIQAIHAETAAKVLAALNGHYVEHRADECKDDMLSMNGAFLVKSSGNAQFEQTVYACDALFNGLLTFKLVGPLPAYSFIELAIALDDKTEISSNGLPTQPVSAANHGAD
jgi:hypothetical protein